MSVAFLDGKSPCFSSLSSSFLFSKIAKLVAHLRKKGNFWLPSGPILDENAQVQWWRLVPEKLSHGGQNNFWFFTSNVPCKICPCIPELISGMISKTNVVFIKFFTDQGKYFIGESTFMGWRLEWSAIWFDDKTPWKLMLLTWNVEINWMLVHTPINLYLCCTASCI